MTVKKYSQAKINQQNKINQTLNNKSNNFPRALRLLTGQKLFALRFGAFLCSKPFGKKINGLEIVLITSLYYTTATVALNYEEIKWNLERVSNIDKYL